MANDLRPLDNMEDGQSGDVLGLAEAAPEIVQQLVDKLDAGTMASIHDFGRDLGQRAAEQTDSLLEQAKSRDLDEMGGRLSEIVTVAKSLNLGALSDQRSKVPLIGGWIDKIKLKGGAIMVRFQSVRSQVDDLVDQVQSMQGGLASRVQMLEQQFESVKQEHALLGAHIAAGDIALGKLGDRLVLGAGLAQGNPMKAQATQDLRNTIAALEKRISDMRMLQHSALQQLPMIRMVQANNRMLIEKFHNIKELTVPAWKRQFMLALSLNEQKNAVDLANHIDDATNEFLRENARLLKDNTVATARANQRLVIDVQTLQQVHDSLMSTLQEVLAINQEGVRQRSTVGAQLLAMRQQLTRQIGAG